MSGMKWSEVVAIVSQLNSDADRARFNALMCGAFCEHPQCERFGEIRRQNTAYDFQLSNWARFCDEHQAEADAFWAEQWAEYYAGLL